MHSYTGCIGWTFLQHAFSYVSSSFLEDKMHSHIGCICVIFLHCEFSNANTMRLCEQMQNHTCCIYFFFPSVYFHVPPQSICLNWCIVTLGAFICLFHNVCFQMYPYIYLSSLQCEFLYAAPNIPFDLLNSYIGHIWITFHLCVFWDVFSDHSGYEMQNGIGYISLTFLQCEFLYVPYNGWFLKIHNHIACICFSYFLDGPPF